MKDFTLKIYKLLLEAILKVGYSTQRFNDFISYPKQKTIILRHDVDKLPQNSLTTAKIEHNLGISGTYYFRTLKCSWNDEIIKEIASLGHEIGYHYENLTTCNGDIEKAYDDFCFNLEKLRKIVPVSTICMHGSPRSKWDSKDLWKHYDYKGLGIIGEPYFDIDFSKVFYLTDTGRRWDGYRVSVRDKIPEHQDRWNKQGLSFRTTQEIINNIHKLPNQIMITVHPQRWHNFGFLWTKELLWQGAKNVVKEVLVRKGET